MSNFSYAVCIEHAKKSVLKKSLKNLNVECVIVPNNKNIISVVLSSHEELSKHVAIVLTRELETIGTSFVLSEDLGWLLEILYKGEVIFEAVNNFELNTLEIKVDKVDSLNLEEKYEIIDLYKKIIKKKYFSYNESFCLFDNFFTNIELNSLDYNTLLNHRSNDSKITILNSKKSTLLSYKKICKQFLQQKLEEHGYRYVEDSSYDCDYVKIVNGFSEGLLLNIYPSIQGIFPFPKAIIYLKTHLSVDELFLPVAVDSTEKLYALLDAAVNKFFRVGIKKIEQERTNIDYKKIFDEVEDGYLKTKNYVEVDSENDKTFTFKCKKKYLQFYFGYLVPKLTCEYFDGKSVKYIENNSCLNDISNPIRYVNNDELKIALTELFESIKNILKD